MPQNNKLTAVKIKQTNGTYSNQIPIGAKSDNIQYKNTQYNLNEVLGNINTFKGSLQSQIDNIDTDTIAEATSEWLDNNTAFLPNEAVQVDTSLSLSGYAADAKSAGDLVVVNQPSTASTKLKFKTTNDIVNLATMDDIPDLTDIINEEQNLKSTLNTILIQKRLQLPSWSQGGYRTDSGSGTTSSSNSYYHRIRISLFDFDTTSGIKVIIPDGYKALIFKYDVQNSQYISHVNWQTGTFICYENVKYKLALANLDDTTDIARAAGDNVQVYTFSSTDKTLSEAGKPADAKAVGDRYNQLFESLTTTYVDQLSFEQGNISSGNGGTGGNSGKANFDKRIRDLKYYQASFGFNITVPDEWRCYIFYYSEDFQSSFVISSEQWFTGTVNQKASDMPGQYIRFVFSKTDNSIITPQDISSVTLTRTVMNIGDKSSQDHSNQSNSVFSTSSWGIANALANSMHIAEVEWTPVGNMPKGTANNDPQTFLAQRIFFDQTKQKGIPYSSAGRDLDKIVGVDVSIHTFLTAVRDPNSVLYTRYSTAKNSSTYYGSVCSSMVNYALQTGFDFPNYVLSSFDVPSGYQGSLQGGWNDLFETVPSISVQPGDIIGLEGHVALVYDVSKDEYGRVNSVTVRQEWRSLPRTKIYSSWQAFYNYLTDPEQPKIIRRYKYIDGVPYTPMPEIQCFDEVAPEEIVYPDVQTDHGDQAVFKKGENVQINIIDAKDFTTIRVKKDGSVIQTRSTIAPFVIENVDQGLYTIEATGSTSSSTSTFYVVELHHCSFNKNTGIITFGSTNATPKVIYIYNLPETEPRAVRTVPILLTDQDRIDGDDDGINISQYLDIENGFEYAKVSFSTPYGTATWYCEDHARWALIPS